MKKMRKIVTLFKAVVLDIVIFIAVFAVILSDKITVMGEGFDYAIGKKNAVSLVSLLWSKAISFIIRLLKNKEYRFFFSVNILISVFTAISVKEMSLNIVLILLFGIKLLNLFNQLEEKKLWDKCKITIWFSFFISCLAIYFLNVTKMVAIDMGLKGSITYHLITIISFILMFYNLKALDYRTFLKKQYKASVA